MKKEIFCFENGDFLIIEKQETDTIPCHLKIIAGGEQEIDLLDNLIRYLTKGIYILDTPRKDKP